MLLKPQLTTGPLANLVTSIRRFFNDAAIAGSGVDEEVLAEHGSAQCRAKAISAGRMNIAASALGGIGAMVKTYLLASGLFAGPIALAVGGLYFIFVWNLERSLAAGINAFWSSETKVKAFVARAIISGLICTFQAVPIILVALDSQVQAELAKFELTARKDARVALESLHGVGAMNAKTAQISSAAREAAQQVHVLPESVIDAKQMATTCDRDAEELFAGNKKKAAGLNAKLPALSNIELSTTATVAQKHAAKRTRDDINVRLNKLADEVVRKKAECKTGHSQAEEAKTRYIAEATAKAQKIDTELDAHKRQANEVEKALRADEERADVTAKKGNAAQTAAELKAVVSVISNQMYALLLATLIWLACFSIDMACVFLKLINKPGPYDHALRRRNELTLIESTKSIRDARQTDLAEETVGTAKLKGLTAFHQQDGGAVYARLEQLALDERVRIAETIQDVRIAQAQMTEIETLANVVDRTIQRVNGNPALVARLHEVLAILRGTAPATGSAA